ncbi:MAG: helix-turn-helix domain-containing protein [Firmicutes bacterium]|nr:helix-turn-helix domain-containing protein [Bacillota bacterium]
MNQELGLRIKALRGARGMTQEALAAALGVSPQAVSKWETGVTAPDIGLLPGISVAFGVTIDELFSLSDTEHLARIQRMITNTRDIPDSDFTSAEAMLRDIAARKPGCDEAWLQLADLYCSRIATLTRAATGFAKQALQLEPAKKCGHSILQNLGRGYGGDWTQENSLALVRYYRGLMRRAPDYEEGWRFLLPQLIGNGLLEEARETVERQPAVKNHMLAKMWLGDIAYARGEGEQALALWHECVNDNPGQWRPHGFLADRMIFMGRYEDAIREFEAWLALQEPPPYCDPYICMALLYEELGDIAKAIEMRKAQLQLLRGMGFEDGEAIDAVEREIRRLGGVT